MSHQTALGAIHHPTTTRKTDFLYRLSLKGLVRNEQGEVLVVKETDRQWWDLPGGGMDHHEDLRAAIAREMKEEVDLEGGGSHTASLPSTIRPIWSRTTSGKYG